MRGRTYLDYVLGSGPLLLGHAHPAVVRAVQEQVARGSTFHWLSEPSIRLAETVVGAVPCAEQVRFVSTGTEATMFACRMARAFTRREKILKFEGGWHGFHDYAMVGNWRVPSEAPYPHPGPDIGGIPGAPLDSVLVAPFNDLATTERIATERRRDLAAIIVEPLQRSIRPRPGFLAGLRDLAQRLGALLIFDEVVTGFRLAYGGAQEYYGVVPDLAVYGKALTCGFSLAAIAGRADVMATADPARKGSLDYAALSGTLSGNALACAAGIAALGELRRPGVYERLHALGERLRSGIARRADAARRARPGPRGRPDRPGLLRRSRGGPVHRSRPPRGRRTQGDPVRARVPAAWHLHASRHEALPLPRAHGRGHRLDARRHGRVAPRRRLTRPDGATDADDGGPVVARSRF